MREDNREIMTGRDAELYQVNNPNAPVGIRRAAELFSKIHSWPDVELYLLRGQGLSKNTYRSYMTAVRQLYEFTEGLTPFQITPAHLEGFYDHCAEKVERNTVYNRIQGLKRFFRGLQGMAPGWVSPFDVLPEKLAKKFSKTKKGKTKGALTADEIEALLRWLHERREGSVIDFENYALFAFLITSGLRAAELCSLCWRDLDFVGTQCFAHFVGKGEKEAEQEVAPQAIEAVREYFRKHFRRDPRPEDHLFWSDPIIKGNAPRPMDPHALWYRIKKIGKDARAEGVIRENRKLTFSPHLFRRSFATYLYSKGMKLKALKELTRHSSIEVLADHYIDDREASAPYFEALFAPA